MKIIFETYGSILIGVVGLILSLALIASTGKKLQKNLDDQLDRLIEKENIIWEYNDSQT